MQHLVYLSIVALNLKAFDEIAASKLLLFYSEYFCIFVVNRLQTRIVTDTPTEILAGILNNVI